MLGKDIEDELYHDFSEALKKIDFKGYRASSPEFMNAVLVGAMWRLVCKANKKELDMWFDKHEEGTEKMTDAPMAIMTDVKEIEDKLQACQDHYDRYADSSEKLFYQMALEELHHAEMLIKKAGEKMTSGEYQTHVKCYEDWYRKLHDRLNNGENVVK